MYAFGPIRIETGDPFGIFERDEESGTRQEVLVYPRLYRPDELGLPYRENMGNLLTRKALYQDPTLLAGGREYQPGDPLKTIHWKATARTGVLQVRLHDPTTTAQVMIVLTAAYVRGVMISQAPPSHDVVLSRFGFGFGVYFLGIVLLIARGAIFQSSIWHVLVLTGVGYVVLAMMTLALSRLEFIREPGAGLSVALAVGLQLAVLIILAFGSLQLLRFNLFGDAYAASRPIWDTIGNAGYQIVLALAAPVQWVENALRARSHHGGQVLRLNPAATGSGLHARHPRSRHPRYWGISWVSGPLLIVIICGILYGIWRVAVRIPHHRPASGYWERRHFILSVNDIVRRLAVLVRAVFHRGASAVEHVAMAARRRIEGDWPADPARRLYVQLLRKAARAGLPRPLAATPMEFQRSLAQRWPAAEGHFEAITEAYMECRYHEAELPKVYVEQLRRHGFAALEAMG